VKRWLVPMFGLLILDGLALHDVLMGEADLRWEAAVLGLSLIACALFIMLARRNLVPRETSSGAEKRE